MAWSGAALPCCLDQADALNEYIHAYELSPDEPLTSLCLGICLLKDAMDFRATHRHKTVLQVLRRPSAQPPRYPPSYSWQSRSRSFARYRTGVRVVWIIRITPSIGTVRKD